MSDKYERCVQSVKRANKERERRYNPWAVCSAKMGRKGGRPTEYKAEIGGRGRRVYEGPRGGLFYVRGKKRVYI